MEYKHVSDYLTALLKDPSLAAVPIQMAADALDVSHAAIAGRLRKGTLEELRIGRTRLVRASSISAQTLAFDADVAAVRSFLEEIASTGVTTTYTPVMKVINRSPTIPNDRAYIGKVLGVISEATMKEGRGFMLSALVYNTSLRRPSDSFYGLADDIDETYENFETDEEYLQEQLSKIYAAYSR